MYYVDKDGREISSAEHTILRMDERYSMIALAVSSDGRTEVSTVWIGRGYAMFQTMVFEDNDGGAHYEDTFDLDTALDAHARYVEQFITDAGEVVL